MLTSASATPTPPSELPSLRRSARAIRRSAPTAASAPRVPACAQSLRSFSAAPSRRLVSRPETASAPRSLSSAASLSCAALPRLCASSTDASECGSPGMDTGLQPSTCASAAGADAAVAAAQGVACPAAATRAWPPAASLPAWPAARLACSSGSSVAAASSVRLRQRSRVRSCSRRCCTKHSIGRVRERRGNRESKGVGATRPWGGWRWRKPHALIERGGWVGGWVGNGWQSPCA
eukprot:358562-Chlamydomonas_euryale.AAC.2